MGSFKFFYKYKDQIILTITADQNLEEADISPIMDEIMNEFIDQGYESKLTTGLLDESIFDRFTKIIDKIVMNAIEELQSLVINRQTTFRTTKPKAVTRKKPSALVESMKFERSKVITEEEAQILKEKITETLEQAEYFINYSEFKEGSVLYGVAAGLFEELGDYEKAKVFKQFAEKLKDMAIYKTELLIEEARAEEEKSKAAEAKIVEEKIKEKIVPIVDIDSIQNDKILDILNKAYNAEAAQRYQEAITYYNSAAGLFLINNMSGNADNCSKRIKELVKKQQTVPVTPEPISEPAEPESKESELIIAEELVPDEGIKNLLRNAALAEKLRNCCSA